MHIHRDRLAAVSNAKILDMFCKAKPRRLEIERLEEIGSSNGHFFNQFLIFFFRFVLLLDDYLNNFSLIKKI